MPTRAGRLLGGFKKNSKFGQQQSGRARADNPLAESRTLQFVGNLMAEAATTPVVTFVHGQYRWRA